MKWAWRGALGAVVLAVAAVAIGAAAGAGPVTTGCHIFADPPQLPTRASLHARLYAWGEVHCVSPTDVTV
jgi:hypothetical protein